MTALNSASLSLAHAAKVSIPPTMWPILTPQVDHRHHQPFRLMSGNQAGKSARVCQPVGIIGRSERIRTSDPCLPKTVLYQAELHSADHSAAYTAPKSPVQEAIPGLHRALAGTRFRATWDVAQLVERRFLVP